MPTVIELSRSEFDAYDRRRPGRMEDVSPAFLPLLRGSAPVNDNQTAYAELADDTDDPDNLAAAKGIILAVGISAGFWLSLGAIVGWWL